jgi:hypothetical protein
MSTTEMQRAPAVIKLPPAERSAYETTGSGREREQDAVPLM